MLPLYQKLSLFLMLLGLCACSKQDAAEVEKPAADVAPATMADDVPLKTQALDTGKSLVIPSVDATSLAQALSNAEAASAQKKWEGWESQSPAALEWYLAVLRFKPDHAAAQAGLQNVLQTLLDEGLSAQMRGDISSAQHLAGLFQLKEIEFPASKAFLKQMPAVLKANDWFEKGHAFEKQQKIFGDEDPSVSGDENAVSAYLAALSAWPKFQPAADALSRLRVQYQNVAIKQASQAQYDAALLTLKKIQVIDPKNPDYLQTVLQIRSELNERLSYEVGLGHLAVDALRIPLAKSYLQKAFALSPTDVSVKALAKRIDNAKHYGLYEAGQVFSDDWAISDATPELVVIPYGSFRMGSDLQQTANKQETPAHQVTFARGFAIARSEITVAQFKTFIEHTQHQTRAEKRGYSIVFDEKGGSLMQKQNINWRHDHLGRLADAALPVVHINLHDAQAYATWLSQTTGQRYRLPSEAEFEYVQAAGVKTGFAWGDTLPKKSVANLAGAGDKSAQSRSFGNAIEGYRDFYWGPAPVRSFPAERWGSFDMTGNVAEWVEDCWHETYLRAPNDGSAWVNPGCTEGVVRGGSWGSSLEQARIRFRMSADRKAHTAQIGFRVVRVL
jgi:formylglycine-generating enzyme required for sulfatase activity